MEFNGIVHLAFDAVSSCIGSNAAGKIGGIRRIAGAGFFDNNQDSGSFQSCLLQNTVLRTGRKIVTRFSGNGDYALFMPMAATRSIKIPPVVLDRFDDRANFHRGES